MEGEHLLDEIKRYVGFSREDEQRLRALAPRMLPRFPAMSEDFYAHILGHPDAQKAITGGQVQVERLKGTLRSWMEGIVTGPWDHAYYEARARIGRRHVQINLPQQYMFTAMNVIRIHFLDGVLSTATDLAQARAEMTAVEKVLDMELAIMLHTYREDYLSQMQRSERLATFGQLVATIGHELRNPLGVMESSLYLLRGRVADDGPVKTHFDRIHNQIRLANRIIGDMLDMVRDRPARRRPVAVAELLTVLTDMPDATTCTVVTQISEDLALVEVDPEQVQQILVNLVSNGCEAAGPKGEVRVLARPAGEWLSIVVNDSGPGIDPAIQGRLFEPLVTTKTSGIGLGLALCRRLAERNGGTIGLTTGPLPGAAFELKLPTSRNQP